MNWGIMQKAGLSAAFVAGGWLAATVAHGAPTIDPSVVAIQARVAALESAQAKAGTFTQDGSGNWSFAPASGSVFITSQKDINVKAGANASLASTASMSVSSGGSTSVSSGLNLTLSSAAALKAQAANATVTASGPMNVSGALLVLNGGTKPLIDATAVPFGLCPYTGGQLQNAQLVGGSAPTVLVP